MTRRGHIKGARFKIGAPEECWPWLGGKTTGGYGTIWVKGNSEYAHRLVYRMLVGEIPEGLHIDHLCRNRSCVNPSHMEVVTNEENLRRGIEWRRAHPYCRRGHLRTAENIYYRPSGKRECRDCRDEDMAAFKIKNPTYFAEKGRERIARKHAGKGN